MKNSGRVNLNGAWISSEDLHANRLMRERREERIDKALAALIILAMIAFAVVIAW